LLLIFRRPSQALKNLQDSTTFCHLLLVKYPIDQTFVSIFYHVLGPSIPQLVNDASPFGPMILDVLQNDDVLTFVPVSVLNAVVQVVLPPLPALLGSLEELSS